MYTLPYPLLCHPAGGNEVCADSIHKLLVKKCSTLLAAPKGVNLCTEKVRIRTNARINEYLHGTKQQRHHL